MRLVAILAVLTARALAADCPAGCDCGEAGGELEYICRSGEAVYQVNGLPNAFVRIHCEQPNIPWSELLAFPLSSNGTLEGLSLSNCALPSTIASVLANLGANDVQTLNFNGAPGELTAEHVKGLRAVTAIMMIDAADQTRIPYDVFDVLPALKDFRIRGAQLRLEENGGDSPAPRASHPHPALRTVELASSGITDVPPGAFARLTSVNKLYLWRNNIENITSESFQGLDQLDELDLSGNKLRALPPRAFASAPRLRALTLVATHLATVPTDAFEGSDAVEEILFKFGRARIKFGPRALAALPALKKLTFDVTALDPLPSDLLDGSAALEELTIKGTGLEVLPKDLFKSQKRITKLDLSDNKIKELDNKIFWPLKALHELNLDGNRIEVFPEQLFSGLTNLTSVTANNNKLKHIADDAFQGCPHLTTLYLNHNALTLKPPNTSGYADINIQSPFRTLFDLKELHLQGNNISDIFSDWTWLLVTNLEKLDLSWNNYTYLTATDIQFLASNLVIDLRHNRISNIDVLEATAIWPDELLPTPNSGAVILLDDNPFRCDCQMFMLIRRVKGSKPLATEAKLDLGDARCASPPNLAGHLVKEIPPSALTCKLRPTECPDTCNCEVRPATFSLELDCQAEPSEYPDPETHGLNQTQLRLHSIKSLTLPNHIVSLNLTGLGLTSPPSLRSLNKVKRLDFSQNGLTTAPMELLNANLSLWLAGNPFQCDCSHFEDVFALQNSITRIEDADNVKCSGGESPWYIDAARLCDVRRAVLLGGALALLGVCTAVIAALTYRYILEIKVFLFYHGWCRSLIHEDELDKDAEYDAFVSFSQEDARWVAEQLVPKLEGDPHNFKLCVHYRDWIVGDMIPAQIARSVEQSRRTIIVLSESFLKSTWASLEFRAANIRAQRERRVRILVVVLGEIPDDSKKMDAELRAYLSTNTYLKWGDPWFWEKLKYAMPHKKTGHTNDLFVGEKIKKGGLDARLNSEGMIVNDGAIQF